MKKFLLSILAIIGFGTNSYAENINFQFYGTDVSIKVKEKGFPGIESLDTTGVRTAMSTIDKKHFFDKTIKNCLSIKDELHLNDWGYFVLLDNFSKAYASKFANSGASATLIMAYLCSKSGYDILLGLSPNNTIGIYYATKGIVYETEYIDHQNKRYYLYKKKGAKSETKKDKIYKISTNSGNKVVEGESYIYEGEKYVICDPTYYGASAGKVMNKWVPTAVAPIKP